MIPSGYPDLGLSPNVALSNVDMWDVPMLFRFMKHSLDLDTLRCASQLEFFCTVLPFYGQPCVFQANCKVVMHAINQYLFV